MKLVVLALVLAVAGPARVHLGPVLVPVPVLFAAAEAILAAAGTWLAVRVIRESRPRRLAGGDR